MGCTHLSRCHRHSCQLEAAHAAPYHEAREMTETYRWAVAVCDSPHPETPGWSCSLAKGHRGPHEGWTDHLLCSGSEPPLRWGQAAAAAVAEVPEMTDWDLLPDATVEDERTLPTLDKVR